MRKTLISIVLPVVMVGCATVPKESVDLSIELTRMIRSAEKSHLETLNLFIAERKQRADQFLKDTWAPRFMESAVKDTGILDSIKAQRNDAQRGLLMKEFSEDAAATIAERRATMMDAIDEIGWTLRERVREHYADMLSASHALTAHIRSVADVNATQTMILDVLKIDSRSLLPLDKVNGILEKILVHGGKVEEVLQYVEEARNILKGN